VVARTQLYAPGNAVPDDGWYGCNHVDCTYRLKLRKDNRFPNRCVYCDVEGRGGEVVWFFLLFDITTSYQTTRHLRAV